MYELKQLRCFVAVGEELHFGRAAKHLHMTQPPLSRQIQMLEQELKIELLARTSRTVRLTVRLVLASSSIFSSCSSIWICRLNGGCVMCRCFAARPKCNSSPTATKQRSCFSSYINAAQVSIYADYSLFRDRSSTIFFRGNGFRNRRSSKS